MTKKKTETNSKVKDPIEIQASDGLIQVPPKVPELSPNDLIARAIEQDIDLDKLEKLMDLRDRWNKEQAEKAFNEAFAEFQRRKPQLIKSKGVVNKDGSHRYNFIPLSQAQIQVDPLLGELGLSYRWVQTKVDNDTRIRVTCYLRHVLGHEVSTSMEGAPDDSGNKNPIQALGSTNSYLNRYTFFGVLGLSADDDDDGISAFPTKEEVKDLQLEKVMDLFMEKQDYLTKPEHDRINKIIESKDDKSYQKVIRTLSSRTKKPEAQPRKSTKTDTDN